MVMESGEVCIMILTLESGGTQKLRATVCIRGETEIGTKENGNFVSNMDRVLISFPMGISILENIRMENLKEKDNILGKMGLFTLANLKMD